MADMSAISMIERLACLASTPKGIPIAIYPTQIGIAAERPCRVGHFDDIFMDARQPPILRNWPKRFTYSDVNDKSNLPGFT